jgi:hypothetical protein
MSNLTSLPTLGIASYSIGNGQTGNGQTFVFGPDTCTTTYTIEVKKDAAGRTSPVAEYTLSLETHLTGNPSDKVVQNAVAILSQPAGILTYVGHGSGDLAINTAVGGWDTSWGPWPKVATCGLNAGQTTRLTWTVTFTKPTAASAVSTGQIMEYNYQADVSIEDGFSTRTVKGFAKIPMTRVFGSLSRKLPDSADLYREQIVPPIPVGFTRMDQQFGIDYAKQTLTFSFVDHQMNPNFPAAGVFTCKASHTWNSEGKGELLRWNATLQGEYTVAPFVGADVVFKAFLDLLTKRQKMIAAARAGEGRLVRGAISAGTPGTSTLVVPLRFSVSEPSIFSPELQKVHCSGSYFVANLGISAIINKGGLWQRVTDPITGNPTTWAAWMTKAKIPLGPRGTANIVFTPNDDSLLDLNQAGLRPTVIGGA